MLVQAKGPGTGTKDTNIDLIETRAAINKRCAGSVTGVTARGGCSTGPDKMADSNRVWASRQTNLIKRDCSFMSPYNLGGPVIG